MLEYHFTCPLPNGLHARPATQLAQIAARHAAAAFLRNERNGTIADCKSVLDLVAAGVQEGDACTLEISGEGEPAAHAALVEFIEHVLPGCDEKLPDAPGCQPQGELPRLLRDFGLTWFSGTAVSPGIGKGRLVYPASVVYAVEGGKVSAGAEIEAQRLEQALAAVEVDVQAQLAQSHGAARGILEATLAMLRDPQLAQAMHETVKADKTAEFAVLAAADEFSGRLAQSESAYLRERVADIGDIGARLVAKLDPDAPEPTVEPLAEASIVCAETLSPAQLLSLEPSLLCGLALGSTGPTSHTVILARSFGIPTLCGVEDMAQLRAGEMAVVDASRGIVIAPLTPEVEKFYAAQQAAEEIRQARLQLRAAGKAQSADGRAITVAANVASAAEASAARAAGAEGIGLLRTEMLYAAAEQPPTEDEQYAVYRPAVEAMHGQPVIIRTFDVGGDKPLLYLRRKPEENPFLGYRGIRVYEDHPTLIDPQLRAVCRASAHGPVWLMAPMVSSVEEMSRFRERVTAVQAQLEEEGIAVDKAMPIGAMVELPAAALAIGKLATVCDFFSIGSNDLCQYFFAADRGNAAVAGLNCERHPAFLRLLKLVVDEARSAGRWIGLCGEMAGDLRNLPLLVGLVLDEISLSAPRIPAIKAAIGALDSRECAALLAGAIDCATAEEVESLLAGHAARAAQQSPLTAPELIELDVDCATKAEAIHHAALLLYAVGRTDDPDALEDALWDREGAFSTGLGHGFAVPHCKTDLVAASTLAVLRLRQGVGWDSLDGRPVDTILLLAMRESGGASEHLKVFAKLARKLMDEGFREELRGAESGDAVLEILRSNLDL